MVGEREDLRGRKVGDFVLRERIGRGGFGAVYRCEQPLLGREAVVKVLHQRLRRNDVVLQRFLREAQLASRLDHPYAAHVYAFGIDHADGLFWIAMEMVQGTTLDRWLRDRGPLSLEQFVPFFERVAEVVQTAHERGIVHRDLKPSNMMVIERAGRLLPKLLDFGVAKLLDDAVLPEPSPEPPRLRLVTLDERADSLDSPSDGFATSVGATSTGSATPAPDRGGRYPLTGAGATLGSPPYMSPEQWGNARTVGPASDLYALAVVAYEALTGRRPFHGDTVADYIELHCHAAVPPLGAGFSPALDRMFQRALAKRPEDRWATALDLAGALRAASGLGSGWADLPRLDETVRYAWLVDAPQPLAESIAALDSARNAHQARDAAEELVHHLLRYLLAVALATHAQVHEDRGDPALLELVRTMRRRDLQDGERAQLLRLLVRPLTSRRGAHPLPELVDLVTARADGTDELDPILALCATTDHAGTEDVVRTRLGRLVSELMQLLRKAAFVLDYALVVPRNQAAERWSGLRRQHRALATVVGGELVEDHPMLLDRGGRICVDLWPAMQAVAPAEGAEPELFVFDGRGRHGARLIAAPAGFEHCDPSVWEWIAARVIAEVDANPDVGGDDQPPYLGLTPFSTTDAARFVGREREVEAFLNRLRQRPLQVVIGPSGAGKSSFVYAGVIPGLPPSWRTVTMRPGAAPLTALATRLAAAKLAPANFTSTDLRLVLETSPAAAAALVVNTAHDRDTGPAGPPGTGHTIVIVIDQLEELFTLCTSADERVQFAAVIAQLAASADAPIRVIGTVRDDFLMQLEALAPLRSALSPALVLLGNPSRDALVRIVVEPARRAGYALSDPELVQDMVSAVADRPGALALLSFTASRLWELRDRRFRQLTRNAYDAMGGVGGALGRHAEATLDTLSASEQRSVREIFRHLVTGDETRAVITAQELRQRLATSPAAAVAEAVIDKLVAARLITVSEGDGEPNAEIIHEALIGAWPRLQQWVREDVEGARVRDQIRGAARQWQDRGRTRDLLWRGDVLLDLERWLRHSTTQALSELETAFVTASQRDGQRARRVRRALRLIALGVIVVFGVFWYRAQQTRVAQQFAEERVTQADIYQGTRALLEGKYIEAVVYLAEAEHRGDSSAGVKFMLARAAQPLRAEVMRLKSTSGRMWTAMFSRDGTRIVTTDDKGARVWDARTGHLQVLLAHDDAVFDAAFTPDDTRFVTAGADGVVKIWDAANWTRVQLLTRTLSDGRRVRYRKVAVSPDGRVVAAIEASGELVDVWDAITGAMLMELSTGSSASRAFLVFSPDGQWLAASGGEGVPVFDTHTWKRTITLAGPQVSGLSFDPTGPRLAIATIEGDTSIWAIPTGTRVQSLHEIGEGIHRVAFSPDGELVVTASLDGAERVWNAKTGRQQVELKNHRAAVASVAFDPSSRQVVSADADGLVVISEVATGLPMSLLEGARGTITDVRFDPTSRWVIAASWDGTAWVWEAPAPYRRWSSPPIDDDCGTDASLDVDGRFLAVSCKHHGTHVWDTAHDRLLADLPSVTAPDPGGEFEPAFPAVSADGDRAAIAIDNTVAIYDLPGGMLVRKIVHPAKVNAVAFARAGHDLVSASIDGALRVTQDGREPWALPAFPGGVDVAGFAPDGRVIAAGSAGKLRVYDPVHATVVAERALPIRARSFRMSWDGRRMLVVPMDTKPAPPVLWDLEHDQLIARLEGHVGQVFTARFVGNDSQILTAGSDGVARLWDSATGEPKGAYFGSHKYLLDAILDPTGTMAITAGGDGVLRFFDAASRNLIWTLRAHKTPITGLHFEGSYIVTRSFTGEVSRWELPAPPSSPAIADLLRCLPLKFDETTGSLAAQIPCDFPIR